MWPMPSVARRASLAVLALVTAGTLAAGCSDGPNPFQASQSSTTVAGDNGDGSGIADNPFIPEKNDLGNCIGALERPNCGSEERSSTGTLLVFLALLFGVGFVMWRIVRGVRQRDAVVNAPKPQPDPGP